MMKRWLGLVLACCMLFTLTQPIATASEATDAAAFVVSNATVTQSAEATPVEVTVAMRNNPGVDRVSFSVEFPEALELVEAPTASDMLPAINFRPELNSPYPVSMGVNASQTVVAPAGTNGVILTLRFNVRANTPAGVYAINLTNQRGIAHNLSRVTFEAVNGSVTVQEGTTPQPQPHSVTVTTPTNGTVTPDKTSTTSGDTVTLTVAPEANYRLATLTVTGTSGTVATTKVNDTTYTFSMPNENVTVSATFEQIPPVNQPHSVTVTAPTNGTVTPDKTSATNSETVTLTVAPAANHRLATLTVTGASGTVAMTKVNDTTYTFSMPDEAVTVSATFEQSNPDNPSNPGGGGCYIATSVYGSYDTPEVWTLRRFRDDVLGQTWYGRLFIKAYYATSPTLVRLFGDAEWFQNFWRDRLDSLVQNLQDDGFESTPYQDKDW